MSIASAGTLWWGVDISTTREPEGREFYVQAADTKGAVMVALGSVSLREGELIHDIHVGPPKMGKPHRESSCIGWHKETSK